MRKFGFLNLIISTNEKNRIYLCEFFWQFKLGSHVDLTLTVASRGKLMSTKRLLEGVVLVLECHKFNTTLLGYVPKVFYKGNTVHLMVSTYQAFKKRRHFRRFSDLGFIS